MPRSSRRPRTHIFDLESCTSLDQPRDLSKIFDSTEYAKWKSFRASEDSRYVGLCLPRILGQACRTGPATKPAEAFNYQEGVDGTDRNKVPVVERRRPRLARA
jgi:type VI secretion system protein ImpC